MLREGRDSVAIIGLGLMGGSLALDLADVGVQVIAFDRDRTVLDAAHRAGIVHTPLDESFDALADASVIVLAVPVAAAAGVLAAVAPRLKRHGAPQLVTDVGSTKRSVIAVAESLGIGHQFIGSHPMAGDHRSGWQAARRGLFADARVYLCRGPSATEASLGAAQALWNAVGASTRTIDAAEHDRLVAFTSHLPHMVSASVARTLAEAGVGRTELARGGRDVTRLAGGSPEVWTAIAADNADNLDDALGRLEASIAQLRRALKPPNGPALQHFLAEGTLWFDDVMTNA